MIAELDRLAEHLLGRVCVVGIGNRLAGDDGAGSVVAERLAGRLAGRVIDAGIAPENHLEPIVRDEPDTILLVDAVDFGVEPGSVRLLDARALATGGLSTHATSLAMIHDYLGARSAAGAVLIGIQPGHLRLGSALSEEVAGAVEAVASRLAELLGPEVGLGDKFATTIGE
ncbi:MAG: hydrogenase maturation protease [Myxococcota bacterium]